MTRIKQRVDRLEDLLGGRGDELVNCEVLSMSTGLPAMMTPKESRALTAELLAAVDGKTRSLVTSSQVKDFG